MSHKSEEERAGSGGGAPPRPGPAALGPWARRDLFNGRGEVRVWDLLARRAAPPFEAALWCELEAGGSVGAHRQQEHPELVVCVAGGGAAWVGDQRHPLAPGACVFLPFGALLRLEAAREEPLSYLIIKAREAPAVT